MSETSQPNYPDILGYIGGGARFTVSNVVDVIVAVRPQEVAAGQPFSVIAVIQNLTDVTVKIFGVIQLPQKDTNEADAPFLATSDTMEHVLFPAEVGYMVLPVNSRLAAAPGDYRIPVEFYVRPKNNARRIRDAEGSSSLDYYFYLSESTLSRMAKLKKLTYGGAKRGLLGSKSLDAVFKLVPGTEWKGTRKKPAWVSLWTMGEHTDGRVMLERYGRLMVHDVFPAFNAKSLYQPLGTMVHQRIRANGYDIQDVETHYITKLMICLLQMAGETLGHPAFEGEDMYRVAKNMNRPGPTDGRPLMLPRWCRVFMERMDHDDRFAAHPVDALAGPLFGEILYDAIDYGFKLMDTFTDINVGTIYEMNEYASQIIDMLWDPEAVFDLVEVYIPLVVGGILVDDRVAIENENKAQNLHVIYRILQQHKARNNPDLEGIIDMAEGVVQVSFKKLNIRKQHS